MFRVLGLVAISVLLSSFGAAAAEDRSCVKKTPIPEEFELVLPGPDIPAEIAGFSGAWSGSWANKAGAAVACHSLVVEKVFANGFAQVVYSHSGERGRRGILPSYRRYVGLIEEGQLSFALEDGKSVRYSLRDGKLSGRLGNGRQSLLEPSDAAGCREAKQIDATPLGGTRVRLNQEDLMRPAGPGDGLVHTSHYAAGPEAAPALHEINGTLHLGPGKLFIGAAGCLASQASLRPLPIDFVTVGADLVPVERGILHPPTSSGHFELILSPGRIWSEPGDGGYSRAAFPFVFVSNDSNATHNGMGTFLFNDKKVSQVWLQIVQETAPWRRYDAWGSMTARYEPKKSAGAAAREAFGREKADALTMRPLDSLRGTVDAKVLDQFDGAWGTQHVSASGLLVDDVLYARCRTRLGPYPFCRHMRHGVFSVTKSMLGALTLFRLAALYGDEVLDERVSDYLPGAKDRDGWEDVTFAHLLSMAAGIGNAQSESQSVSPFADSYISFGSADRDADRVRRALKSYGNLRWGPGKVMRYIDAHTYLLGAAMARFHQSKAGADADLWAMIRDEVFRPIGVHHLPYLRSPDQGLPALSHGAYPTMEGVAKIARLLHNDGRHGDAQLLSRTAVRQALYRGDAVGLATGFDNRFGQGRYHLSFWGLPVKTTGGCAFTLPVMAGYGGNWVLPLPSGVLALRFSDGFNRELEHLVAAAWPLKPHCGSIDESGHEGALSRDEASAALSGNTLYSGDWHIYLAPEGTIFSRSETEAWLGRWRVDEAGRYCSRYSTWRVGTESCSSLHRQGEQWVLRAMDRWEDLDLRRVVGNPEGY